MSTITISTDSFCRADEVARKVADRMGLRILDDETICRAAADPSGVSAQRLEQWMHGPRPWMRDSDAVRIRGLAWLRHAVTAALGDGDAVVVGAVAHLVSPRLPDVIRIGLVAPPEHRVAEAVRGGASPRSAERTVARDDEHRAAWTEWVAGRRPWDSDQYDLVLAMQDRDIGSAADSIVDAAMRLASPSPSETAAARADARLEAEIAIALADSGHDAQVRADDGHVTILLNRGGLFPDRVKHEIVGLVSKLDGVTDVTARLGPRSGEPDVLGRVAADLPPRVLLVDDERDFVDTLSERLRSRSFDETTIAYDGEQALAMVEADQPEVMVLDLRMPGIDGLEVLRRVKMTHPETEVIILTGHGSEAEESLSAELGAFAYLRKPVDIELLTSTMQAARQSANRRRADVAADD